jgi:hypothetical protein
VLALGSGLLPDRVLEMRVEGSCHPPFLTAPPFRLSHLVGVLLVGVAADGTFPMAPFLSAYFVDQALPGGRMSEGVGLI